VVELIVSPVGSVSPRLIAGCAGFVPGVREREDQRGRRPSAIETAPKVLATVGTTRLTTRHWSVDVLVALVVVTTPRGS